MVKNIKTKSLQDVEKQPAVKKDRYMQLEGLRGVAAIIVVFYHFILMFYPNIAYGTDNSQFSSPQHIGLEGSLYGNIFAGAYSGMFAVCIFFVLSGFVLSIGFFSTGKDEIIKKLATKRYIRLMLPALASIILAFIIITTGLSSYREIASGIVGGGSTGLSWNVVPDFFEAIKDGVLLIFTAGNSGYNGALWTMMYEFTGSFMVFITLLVFGKSHYRPIVYLILTIVTFNTWYMGFVFGMGLADLYANRYLSIENKLKKIPLVLGLLVIGLFLGGYPVGSVDATIYHLLRINGLTEAQNTSIYLSIGAALFIAAILISTRLSSYFAHPRVSKLGKYTYSLYLSHALVLLAFTTFLFVIFNHYVGYNKAALLSMLISIPVVIGVTWLFERYIDRTSIHLSNRFAALVHE